MERTNSGYLVRINERSHFTNEQGVQVPGYELVLSDGNRNPIYTCYIDSVVSPHMLGKKLTVIEEEKTIEEQRYVRATISARVFFCKKKITGSFLRNTLDEVVLRENM
jgi:hypothetical protein